MAVLGVDSNDTSEAAATRLLVGGARATYPVAVDAHADGGHAVPREALPVSYFLNAEGQWSGRPSVLRRSPRWSAGSPGSRPRR